MIRRIGAHGLLSRNHNLIKKMTITEIIAKLNFYTKTNSNSLTVADALLLINNAYERVSTLILKVDGRFQWIDDNLTGPPATAQTITSGTQNYAISVTYLAIHKVEMKYSDGKWYVLTPIAMEDFPNDDLDQYFGSSGIPSHYLKVGDEIYLYPNPNFTQAASLKIYYDIGPSLFTSAEVTTGTKVPGFNSLYHDLIPLWASYDYAIANNLPNANQLMAIILNKEKSLQSDYASRNNDERKRTTFKKISYI